MDMRADDFNIMFGCISPLEHQQMLIDMKVMMYPHLKKDAARKLHKHICKKAFPDKEAGAKPLTSAQAEAMMNRVSNG